MKLFYQQKNNPKPKKKPSLCNHNVFIDVLKVILVEVAASTEHSDNHTQTSV